MHKQAQIVSTLSFFFCPALSSSWRQVLSLEELARLSPIRSVK